MGAKKARSIDLFAIGFSEDGKEMIAPKKNRSNRTVNPNVKRATPRKLEQAMQRSFCEYIKTKYPALIFTSDLASGMKLSWGQATLAKKLRSSRALPDMYFFIAKRGYHGLILELKADGTTIYLKNGDLCADDHIREQAEILKQLNDAGYHARFVIGITQAIEILEWYLSTE